MIAKFWVFHPVYESWVMLRLTGKHTMEDPLILHQRSGQTDEGHSSYMEAYWLEEDGVHSITVEDGRDCDGRYHHHAEHVCSFDNLQAGGIPQEQVEPTGEDDGWRLMGDIKKPLWKEVNSEFNDYSAQAANY